MTITGVIFDFDGVIVDSESLHLRAFQRVLAARGWTLTTADYYARYLGYSDLATFEAFARHEGLTLAREEISGLVVDKTDVFAELTAAGPVVFASAPACIRRLAETFTLAIASGSFRHEIVEVLLHAGLQECFAAVVGADDVNESKPDPAPYLEAARRLNLPPNACVAIEDAPWGLESARRAGLRTIGITHTYARERLTDADVVVASLDEVTAAAVRSLVAQAR
jgi:beta-phosphoglucomutase